MNSDSWLVELPAEAEERKFLLAADADRPPTGAVDRGWQALCATAGIVAVTTAVPASAAAASVGVGAPSASAAGTAGAVVGVASKGVVVSLATKSIAVGFAVGVGVLGTAHLAEQLARSESQRGAESPVGIRASSRTMEHPWVAATSASPAAIPAASSSAIPDPLATSMVSPSVSGGVRASATPSARVSVEPSEPSSLTLSAQAEELAMVKRMLDSGEVNKGLARLRASVANGAISALAEDRDALYVEALARTGQEAEARRVAERFRARYPQSPHRDKVSRFIGSE